MGAVAVGATIYFGSKESSRQIVEIAECFERAHELGMAMFCGVIPVMTPLKKTVLIIHTSADLTGQANHLGATIQAEIIKQSCPPTMVDLKP
jgi:class I fructose-bisphosphate aldolase